jgi:hypothetical protein
VEDGPLVVSFEPQSLGAAWDFQPVPGVFFGIFHADLMGIWGF